MQNPNLTRTNPIGIYSRLAHGLGLVSAIVVSTSLLANLGQAQIVQLPTTGTFSLQTSVMAPDSGSTFLGGNRSTAASTKSLGPGSLGNGVSSSAAGASVHATIIDLNELDLMIRSQSGSKPYQPKFSPTPTKPSPYSSQPKGSPSQSPEYGYLAALTHTQLTSQKQFSSDTDYYLSLAASAKQSRHWASVELYYKLAWESLPESRRLNVLKSLDEAKKTAASTEEADPKPAVR